MGAVRALCGTSLLLESGTLAMKGETNSVVSTYLSHAQLSPARSELAARQRRRAGTGDVWIPSVETLSIVDSKPQTQFLIGESFRMQISYEVQRAARGTFFILIATDDGTVIFSSFQRDNQPPLDLVASGQMTADLADLRLSPGRYRISAGIFDSENNFIEWAEDVGQFEILAHFFDGGPFDHRLGFITKPLVWANQNEGVAV